jgi:hypothetical protein
MFKLISFAFMILVAGTTVVHGQEWLSPYPDYLGIGSYFTDSLFYPGNSQAERISYESQYYPYFGKDFFSDNTNTYEHSQKGIVSQRKRFESPFYPYFGERFLSWGESYPAESIAYPAPTYPVPTIGDTPVTIISQGMRGYQVFLDGSYIGTEGMNGDPLDGRFGFRVIGGSYHDVRVYDGQFNYPKRVFFPKGDQKIIYVEPGTAVYI